jgi:hypothetical protein
MPLDLLSPHRLDYAHPVNWEAPLNRGLLAWWQVLPQSMGGTRLLDLTGRAPMVLTGFGASSAIQGWGPTWRPGGWGELRWPTSSTVQGSVAAPGLLANAPAVTLSVWAWQRVLDVPGYLWSQYTSTTVQWSVETFNDGNIYIELNVGSGNFGSIDYSTVMAAQAWTHLVVVFQGSGAAPADRLKLYVNGLPKTLSYSGTIPSVWPDIRPAPLVFGRSGSAAGAWDGKLDDWRIWLRALAAPEVQQLYLRSRLRSPTELRWRSPLHVVPLLGYEQPEVTAPGAVPAGMTVLWSGTAASIPSGWTRATALDGLYPRGAAAAADPGTSGGALTHAHTSTAHSHTTAHTHTVPASTTPTGSTARDTGTTNPPAVHTHAATVTVNPTTATATDTPNTDSGSLEPPYAEVLFLRSSGTAMGFPAQTLALWNEAGGLPSGWELADGTSGKPDLRGRYLKGAAAAGDGGGSGGALTHSHTLASHMHSTPYAHTHPDVTSNQRTEALVAGDVSGATAATATATHTHALTIASAPAAITGSTDAVSSTNHEPPYWVQAYIQNISGALSWPDKLIALWTGSLASIPANWKLCDGTNGTPDLRLYFVKGATTLADIGQSGGSVSHTHTATGHTHAIAGHTHAVTGAAGAGENRTAGATNAPTTAHTHTWPDATSTSLTSGSTAPTVTALGTTTPPYTTVVFLQWQPPGGAAALTQAAQTLTSAGTLPIAGTAALTQTAQTLTSTGVMLSPIAATTALTQAAQTLTGTGSLAVQATTALPQAAQTLTSAGALAAQATTALTQAAQTLTGSAVLMVRATTALLQAAQTLTSPAVLALQATTALTQAPQAGSSAGTLRLTGTTALIQAAQTLTALGGHEGPFVQGRWPFGLTDTTTIPGAAHGLGTAALFVQVYDAASPQTQLQAAVTVHPTTYDVRVTFGVPTAGTVLVSVVTTPSAGRLVSVAEGTSLSYPGAAHGRGTGPLFVQLFDATGAHVSAQIQVAPTTGDVLVTLPAPMDGHLVVAAPSSALTPGPSATPFSGMTSVTVPATTHGRGSPHLLVAVYDAQSPAALLAAPVTVNPSTQAVTATFLVAQAGTLLIGGGGAPLAATVALVQAAQTLSSTSTLRLTGTVALTQEAQTLVGIGGSQALGLVHMTQGDQALTSTGTVRLAGASAVTQAAQTLSSTGFFLRQGTLAVAQESQTLTSTGGLHLAGDSSLTQGEQTLASTSFFQREGTLATTQAAQTLASTAAVGLAAATALTQAAQTLVSPAALRLQATASLAQAEQALTSSATLFTPSGAVLLVQEGQALASTARLVVDAGTTLAQEDQTLESTAGVVLAATLALAQDDATVEALGTHLGSLGAVSMLVQDDQQVVALCAPTPPMPLPATGTLTRVEYSTEVHFFTPSGTLAKIVPKIRQPALRRYLWHDPL